MKQEPRPESLATRRGMLAGVGLAGLAGLAGVITEAGGTWQTAGFGAYIARD